MEKQEITEKIAIPFNRNKAIKIRMKELKGFIEAAKTNITNDKGEIKTLKLEKKVNSSEIKQLKAEYKKLPKSKRGRKPKVEVVVNG